MRIAVASFACALVLFVFGFLWWGILMGIVLPANVLNDEALVSQLDDALDESGLYIYPDYATQSEEPIKPWAILYFNKEAPEMGPMMGAGFLHMLVTAFFASLVVDKLSLPSFPNRVVAVFCLGLFVAIWADVGNAIWWRHPMPWTLFHFGYDVISWLLAGLVIASILKPCPKSPVSNPNA